ncbi:helix-turn-helix domain-containing protein [Dysgonomonas sp.]
MSLNIKKTIKDYGLEVREVAKRMDITPTGLSQHINGNPSVEVLERIAKAIGCDISDLFEPKQNIITCPNCGTRLEVKEVDAVAERIAKEFDITPDQVKENHIFSRFLDRLPEDIKKDILSGKIKYEWK